LGLCTNSTGSTCNGACFINFIVFSTVQVWFVWGVWILCICTRSVAVLWVEDLTWQRCSSLQPSKASNRNARPCLYLR
jgi:hypothetical protein